MFRGVISCALAVALASALSALPRAQSGPPAAPASVSYGADVEPILEKNCVSCHGGDRPMGGLDLRTREGAMGGGTQGPVLVPSDSEKSRLYRMVAGLDQPQMPMSGALSPQEIGILKAWIDQGAAWDVRVTFAKDIQPILETSCLKCHGGSARLSGWTDWKR